MIQIRIQLPKMLRIHADPDPQHWILLIRIRNNALQTFLEIAHVLNILKHTLLLFYHSIKHNFYFSKHLVVQLISTQPPDKNLIAKVRNYLGPRKNCNNCKNCTFMSFFVTHITLVWPPLESPGWRPPLQAVLPRSRGKYCNCQASWIFTMFFFICWDSSLVTWVKRSPLVDTIFPSR
jgi:hypothetical protein